MLWKPFCLLSLRFFVAELTVSWWRTSVLLSDVFIWFTRLYRVIRTRSLVVSLHFECIERSWRSENARHFGRMLWMFLRCRVDGVLLVNFSTTKWRLHPVHPGIPGHTNPGSLRLTTLTSKYCFTPGSSVHRELQDLIPGPDPFGSTEYTESTV